MGGHQDSRLCFSNQSSIQNQRFELDHFHGCEVQLATFADTILHTNRFRQTRPTIRSYSDGIKVGCTFITTEALEKIYAWHKEFLGREESRTHQ